MHFFVSYKPDKDINHVVCGHYEFATLEDAEDFVRPLLGENGEVVKIEPDDVGAPGV